MKKYNSVLLILFLQGIMFLTINAQPSFNIGISKDATSSELEQLSKLLQKEITALTKPRFNVTFKESDADWNPSVVKQNIQAMMDDSSIDLIITVGFISSNEASHLSSYSKPVIAANILDGKLQHLPLQQSGSTGIDNFTYIGSIMHLGNDVQSFVSMFDVKELTVIMAEPFSDNYPGLAKYLSDNAQGVNVSFVSVADSCSKAASEISLSTDAVFVLPLVQSSPKEIEKMFSELNGKKTPTLAVSGVRYLEMGATVTLTPEYNFQQLARQVALRILKVEEGENLSGLNVTIDGMKRIPIVNMASIRFTNKFPKWNVINNAVLLNTTKFPLGKRMNLRVAIAEALENNLQGKMSGQDLLMAEKDVRIAKANIYPQIEISGTAVELSTNLVEASMGQKGEFTITGSAILKQVLFSESVFANITINKLMEENIKIADNQIVLDIITNIGNAYIGLLFAKSNLLIQNENVNATMQNLQMAKAKEKAGQGGISDVNRWVSELNLNKMKLNDAYTLYRTNMYQINQLLNSPIDKGINIPDSNTIDKTIVTDLELLSKIFINPVFTEKYAGFILQEMEENSPEIKQLITAGNILERKKTMYLNKLYLPDVAVWGGLDQAFIRNGTIQPVGMPVPPPPDDLTWNVGLRVSFPLFEGGRTSTQMQKSGIELDKINFQKKELFNKLEAGIRANVQKLRTSYLELELSKNAAAAAEDNFKVVQDAYFQGMTNLIQLIDAQNVMAKTKHLANIAYYQFVMDYLQIQRLQGKFMFLSSNDVQEAYKDKLKNYLQDYLTKGE